MGWLWSSGVSPKPTTNTKTPNTTTTLPVTPTPAAQSEPAIPESTNTDPEIAKFLSQVQAEFTSTTSTPTTTTTPEPSPGTASEPPLDALSESLLPTTMSCRSAFDLAFHCNSLGGQWTSVYRTGGMRSCSDLWDEFWFCMRTRVYSGTVKEEAIRAYYREKEGRRYGAGRPSSTDVWEPREERLPPGSVFHTPYVKPQISDEEWRRHEIYRRRAIQRMLREEEAAEAAAEKNADGDGNPSS